MIARYHPSCTHKLPRPLMDCDVRTIATFMVDHSYALRSGVTQDVLYFYPERLRQEVSQ